MFRHLVAVMTALCGMTLTTPCLHAQQLIDQVSKDFGVVPRGTLLAHQFRLTNITSSPLHVASIRTSCHCTTATVGKQELQPGEATVLQVSVDTKKFSGTKTFTVFLTIDRPFVEETRVLVQAGSRDDVTLEPGQLTFGRIKKGAPAAASVVVEYHGVSGWQIVGLENENGYLLPQLTKLDRPAATAAYLLEVKLRDDIPVGAWHADIWLKTNDASTPRIRVPLVVEVEGNLTATPQEVVLGQLKPGATSEKRIVIRGSTPFKVTKIEGEDPQLKVVGGTEAKTVQVLKVTFIAGQQPAEVTRKVRVLTDLGGEEAVDFTVQAFVSP
jgi:hypothetical protein